MVGQLMAGDAIKPRSLSFAVMATKAMTGHERDSERLGLDVDRDLRIPGAADQERQDRLRMAVIELRDLVGAQRHRKS